MAGDVVSAISRVKLDRDNVESRVDVDTRYMEPRHGMIWVVWVEARCSGATPQHQQGAESRAMAWEPHWRIEYGPDLEMRSQLKS